MLSDRAKTIIVIPCYNEAARLPTGTLTFFARKHPELDIMLVDDGSTDNTLEVLRQLEDTCPRLRHLALLHNRGKAEAVRQGILAALKEKPALVGFWDADLATPLEEIPDFIATLERGGFQAVTGCRLTRMGAEVRRKLSRHYLGRIFATVVSRLLRLEVYDTQCGAKLFAAALAGEIFAAPFRSRWLFDVELLRRIVRRYGSEATQRMIYEYPLRKWNDVAGSKLTLGRMLLTPFEILKIFLNRND